MKHILLILIILLCSGCTNTEPKINTTSIEYKDNYDTYYGHLIIPKIKMNQGFYNEKSKLNNVNKNIELIPTGIKNTYLFAAHSGVGNIAYFNNLIYLKKGDEIIIQFKNKTNKYEITKIKKEPKTGKINIPNKENIVILTTCDQIKKGYQLIILASLIKT